ncbi:MAG TPA: hypothetical protein VGL46_11945 [Pseudonocardiaceae bacterium]
MATWDIPRHTVPLRLESERTERYRGFESLRFRHPDQDFVYLGDYGENGFAEDYASKVRGEPIANIAVVYRNPEGQTQHLVVNHRPLPSVLLLSRLLGEHFAGTRYARYFATPSAEAGRG